MPRAHDGDSAWCCTDTWYGPALAVVARSLCFRALTRCLESSRVAWNWLVRNGLFPSLNIASRGADSEDRYASVIALAGHSRLLRTLERFWQLTAIGWRASVVRKGILAFAKDPHRSQAQRVRLVGCAMLSATAVHVFLVGASALTRPPVTGVAWVAIAAASLVCVGWSRSVVTAWRRSRIVRALKGKADSA